MSRSGTQTVQVYLPLLLLLLSSLMLAEAVQPAIKCDGYDSDWIRHGSSCYKWIEAENYWYPAEQSCQEAGGHLASIRSEQENTLVARLTYCQAAWIGRYGVDADRLADACNYRWTDGRGNDCGFQRHNFSGLATPHQPLVTAEDLQWRNNFYHARAGYVCQAPAAPPADNRTGESAGCPDSSWRRHGSYCYLQPGFQATYIEAGYFCDGRQANLVSVHSESELRLLSLLDLSQPTCPVEQWLGLVKLNPCRKDFATGQQVCYRWADRSGDHTGFPAWAAGHPNNDLVTNCVVLQDRSMRSEPCYSRRHFVCKRLADQATTTTARPTTAQTTTQPRTTSQQRTTASRPEPTSQQRTTSRPEPTSQQRTTSRPDTTSQQRTEPPTATPETPLPPSKLMAAYNFRRGVENLARPGRFRVLNVGHAVGIGSSQGAQLNGSRGILVDTESSTLTRPLKQRSDWTIFYQVKRPTDYDEIIVDVSSSGGAEPSLTMIENLHSSDLSMYGGAGYFRDESDPAKDADDVDAGWLRVAVVFRSGRAYFYRNDADASSHRPATSSKAYPDNDQRLMLGNAPNSVLPGYRGAIACFGVSHLALTPAELRAAFYRYCS